MGGFMNVISYVGSLVYLGVAIYLLVLATRFVTAIERIADKLSINR